MKFLLDQDVYTLTERFLRKQSHNVLTASEIGHARTDDSKLLEIAHKQKRIFVTRDRDFGGLVFVGGLKVGVIYLRILPSTSRATHQQLQTVFSSYSQAELQNAFVVVEPGRYRFRRLRE